MKNYKNMSDDYVQKRLAEIKEEIRRISRLKARDKFQLPQVGKTPAELKSFGRISEDIKEIEPVDSSPFLKYLNDSYDIIASNTALQERPEGLSLIKRIMRFFYLPLLRRFTHMLLSDQRDFNSQLVRFLNQLANHLDTRDDLLAERLIQVEKKFDELINEIINKVMVIRNQEMVERIDILFSKLDQEIISIDVMQGDFYQDLEKIIKGQTEIFNTLNTLSQNLLLQRKELAELSAQLSKKKPSAGTFKEKETSPAISSEEYVKFEDAFRGTPEEIAAKQSGYVSYFKHCKRVLDIGCGRGEFLKLLKNNGIGAYGVDTNREMVSSCKKQGLEVIEDDGLKHLQSLRDESLDGIFASQFIEHLSPDKFKSFVQLGYQKLKPASCMIVETVNPACLHAYLNTFLLDLSHTKPLHPLALKFLFQIAGFQSVETLFLSPIPSEVSLEEISIPPRMHIKPKRWLASFNRNVERLNKLIFNHQDYAVIGKKEIKRKEKKDTK